MPDPVLVPPTPTVNQGEPVTPTGDTSAVQSFQTMFDRAAPRMGEKPPPSTPPTAPKEIPAPPDTTPKPVQPPQQPPETPPAPEPKPQEAPAFLDSLLKGEPAQPAAAPAPPEDDWPEEEPAFKTPEERKSRYKTWREKWKALQSENTTLKARPSLDENTSKKLAYLESQNREMGQVLNRMSIETNQDFQQKILAPMHAAYSEAARIVKDVGGSTDDLAKALTLSGRAQFEALDGIFREMPESAKAEVNNAIGIFKRYDEARKAALARAPDTLKQLQKAGLERQYAHLQAQKQAMSQLFDEAVRTLREEGKVEVLMKSPNTDDKWWNDQCDNIVNVSKSLYLDNTDMKKMAMACILAPMADTYRRLWVNERMARLKTDKVMRERLGAEPTLTESGGNIPGPTTFEEDLKKPFSQLFMRELAKQRR